MKKHIFNLLIIFFSLICISVSGSENLVKNGGFEEISGGMPLYWQPDGWKMDPADTRFYTGTESPHSGKYYAGIENKQSNDARFIQVIPVEPNTVYKLSCWIRAKAYDPTRTAASVSVLQGNFSESSESLRDTGGNWYYTDLYVRTYSSERDLRVCIRLGGFSNDIAGKAEFDDFRVEKVSDADAGSAKVVYITDPDAANPAAGLAVSQFIAIIIIFLAASLIALIIIFLIRKRGAARGKSSVEVSSPLPPLEKDKEVRRYTKRDYILCGALTFVYACIAYFNLGNLTVPQTHWQPAAAGDSFYVDFGVRQNIKRIYCYEGLPSLVGNGRLKLEYSDDARNWQDLKLFELSSIFYWNYTTVDVTARYIKVITENPGFELNEMVFVGSDKEPIKVENIIVLQQSPLTKEKPDNIFDEQNTFVYRPSMMSGMTPQFDETYHVRTAYEMIHHVDETETSHPPLGKIIIGLGIRIFGMTPFGFRFMGATFGIIMVIIMYMFGKLLFKRSEYAFLSAYLFTFDFMHYVQTRLATIDTYGVFFILLMYYFMYRYYTMDFYKVKLKKTLVPLFFSGLFWGMGAASKWIVLYAAIGLALLFFLTIAKRIWDYGYYKLLLKSGTFKGSAEEKTRIVFFQQNFIRDMAVTFSWCILVFIIIPVIIYTASYIPYMMTIGRNYNLASVWQQQIYMFNYHKSIAPEGVAFATPWYEWPLIWMPYWYYSGSDLPPGKTEDMIAMGNPAIWWICSLCMAVVIIIALVSFIKRIVVSLKTGGGKNSFSFRSYLERITDNDRLKFVIIMFFCSQYLPWIISVRKTTYIYHYFASIPFIVFATVYLIKRVKELVRDRGRKAVLTVDFIVYVYLAIVLILFIMFYPILSYSTIVDKSSLKILKWLPNWPIPYY